MATQKQLAANRRNAEKSTGPRSLEGKAASSRNALKTGLYCRGIIIGKENPQQLNDLEAAFTAEYAPATPTERSLVDSLIHLEWMLRRYRWLETETWYATLDELPSEQRESTWTGHGFIHQPAISRIHRPPHRHPTILSRDPHQAPQPSGRARRRASRRESRNRRRRRRSTR